MTYEAFDVVVVPFPFTDRESIKRRPALILSRSDTFGNRIGHSVLAMITSRSRTGWPLDVPINDGESAGLTAPSLVRMKLFTLDHRLILRKAGRLCEDDQRDVADVLAKLLASPANRSSSETA